MFLYLSLYEHPVSTNLSITFFPWPHDQFKLDRTHTVSSNCTFTSHSLFTGRSVQGIPNIPDINSEGGNCNSCQNIGEPSVFNVVYFQNQESGQVGLVMWCAQAKKQMHTKFSFQKYKEGNHLGP